MEEIRVRLDWMNAGDFITGLSDGKWNGWESVLLDLPAIYALDRAALDAGEGGLFEAEEPPLAVGTDADGALVLYDVSPDGERTVMPSQMVDGVKFYDFQGWCFTAL